MIQAALTSPVTAEIGWTLLHFLWQGLILALVLEAALAMTRSATARHNWALATLALMAAAPLATFAYLHGLFLPQDSGGAFVAPATLTVGEPVVLAAPGGA